MSKATSRSKTRLFQVVSRKYIPSLNTLASILSSAARGARRSRAQPAFSGTFTVARHGTPSSFTHLRATTKDVQRFGTGMKTADRRELMFFLWTMFILLVGIIVGALTQGACR